jgi:hypothetical protein
MKLYARSCKGQGKPPVGRRPPQRALAGAADGGQVSHQRCCPGTPGAAAFPPRRPVSPPSPRSSTPCAHSAPASAGFPTRRETLRNQNADSPGINSSSRPAISLPAVGNPNRLCHSLGDTVPPIPPGRGHGLLGRTYPHVAAASRPRADDARRAVRRSTHLLRTALALDPECIRSLPSRPSHTADHERMRRAQQGCLLPDFGGAWVRRRTPSRNGAPVHPRTRPASRRSPHPGGPQSSNPSEPTLRRASRC